MRSSKQAVKRRVRRFTLKRNIILLAVAVLAVFIAWPWLFPRGGAPEEPVSPVSGPIVSAEPDDPPAGSFAPVETFLPQEPTAHPSETFRAVVRGEASVYAEPEVCEVLAQMAPGQELSVFSTSEPLWYSVVLEDGTVGYLYGEQLYRTENGSVSGNSLFREQANRTLAYLKERLPEGMYWNHVGYDVDYDEETPWYVTDTPCEHFEEGEIYCNFYNGKMLDVFPYGSLYQCLGFASFISDQVFGENAPFHTFTDMDLLRVGDHIRFEEYEHSITVVEITEDYVTVAEVNENYDDCMVSWTRQLTWDDLDDLSWDITCISRYPLVPNENGGFTEWPDDSEAYLYSHEPEPEHTHSKGHHRG